MRRQLRTGFLQSVEIMDASLKIISNGQTGVDRAGLDVRLALGLAVDGWCPHPRRSGGSERLFYIRP